MAERSVVDAKAAKVSKLAAETLGALDGNTSQQTYNQAGNAFREEVRSIEKDPILLKQVVDKLLEKDRKSGPDFSVVLDKDKNLSALMACKTKDVPACVGSVILPPKQREMADKLADAIARDDQDEAGKQASALHKEVIRSFETRDVYTIGNLDQETDARRMRLTDIARHRINPEILAHGSQRSIAFFPPDNFVINGSPYFASVGNRQTRKFEYMIRKDGSIPWNLPVLGPQYGANEDPGRP